MHKKVFGDEDFAFWFGDLNLGSKGYRVMISTTSHATYEGRI